MLVGQLRSDLQHLLAEIASSQQMPQQNQSLFQRIFFRRQTVESFTQAYPAFPANGRITSDLLRD